MAAHMISLLSQPVGRGIDRVRTTGDVKEQFAKPTDQFASGLGVETQALKERF